MTRFRLIVICLLVSVANAIYGQNLVLNGGFEDENICVEYQRNCAPEAWLSTTLTSDYYFQRTRLAHSGTHFAGIITGNAKLKLKRSFLRTRLVCALRKGHQYTVEFFVRSRHRAFDSIGVYFSSSDFLYEKRSFTQLSPHFLYKDSMQSARADSLQWRKISFRYTAAGDEIFLTIGNFKKKEISFEMQADNNGDYYVYVDDVAIIPTDAHEILCPDAAQMKEDIYNESERHEMLVRMTRTYRNNPPQPLRPSPTTLLKIDTLIIPDILFATGMASLNEASAQVLDSFCAAAAAKPFDSLIIAGHTDSVGTLVYNMKLSADRARSVARYIGDRIKPGKGRVLVRYHAYLHPVASNRTAEGRQRNRRVEIFLYRHE